MVLMVRTGIPSTFSFSHSQFNQDVTEIPEAGVWLTLIKDKTVTFNEGLNGFPRLDKVVELAKKYDIRLLIPLTNNWSLPPNSSDLPRNFLANDYGQYPSPSDLAHSSPNMIQLRRYGHLR